MANFCEVFTSIVDVNCLLNVFNNVLNNYLFHLH